MMDELYVYGWAMWCFNICKIILIMFFTYHMIILIKNYSCHTNECVLGNSSHQLKLNSTYHCEIHLKKINYTYEDRFNLHVIKTSYIFMLNCSIQ